ncbi:EAL domain-containing protein [Undibacterium sp. CY7W]|uniref:EAL domain-containing protein n=1 Tax=Undibacterium rugosum TaxID=2762291 RepID=A0A923IBR7_9BURK|nr:EAL domain-containing protein [Undibacterium rugosum]MBC3936390.1 EAL domain-containing protein [Undibacterium rugosum]
MQAERILIVEDEPVVALDLQQSLMEMGHQVLPIATSFTEAIKVVQQDQPSLILMDIHIDGDTDGIDACEIISQRWKLPVIFLTAYADDLTVSRAANVKPFGYVMKPFESKELMAVIQVARSRHNTEGMLAASEQRLTMALDAAQLGSWQWSHQHDKLEGDERFFRILGGGLRPFQCSLADLLHLVTEQDRNRLSHWFQQTEFFSDSFCIPRSGQEPGWIEIYGKLIDNLNGEQVLIGAVRDISLRKRMEDQLRQASVVFSAAVEGMLILDAECRIVNANPAFYQMSHFSEQEIMGENPEDFLLLRRESDPSYLTIAASEPGYWTGEARCKRQDGSLISILQHVCVVRNRDGQTQQIVVSVSDISFIREAEQQLEHLAFHDPLTGMGNRYLLDQRLAQEMSLSQVNGGNVAIIFIDLDGFKAINDSMGHHIGDRLLQEAARRISGQIRRYDEAIRLGGDEFVVIVPNLTQQSDGRLVADKILQALSLPVRIDEHQFRIGASIGIATFPQDGDGLSEILSAADSAMYEAKRQGKGRICVYTSDMTDTVRTRLNLEQCLHHALERQELELYYQPVFDLAEGSLVGFEALIRWNHPVSGLLLPDQFIRIAEECGLIQSIGSWVLDSALQQLSQWSETTGTTLVMAVNVSPKQFLQDDFLTLVEAALRRWQVPAHQLEIEITESTLQDFQRSRGIVSALRGLGVRVAIDDFGTGYSSLALLKHLPVSRIKIDRSFILALPDNKRDLGLVSVMLKMASSLELQVTAEGVETRQQAEALQQLGCPTVQGFYYGYPLPAARALQGAFTSVQRCDDKC